MTDTPSLPPWLVLLYQVPTRSSSVRVRIWRRLQQIGAVQIRQSAYVLPNRDQPREDLQWLAAEIAGLGGQATVLTATAADAGGHDDIVAAFRHARGQDVQSLLGRGRRLLKRLPAGGARPGPVDRSVRAFLDEWRRVNGLTYFGAPGTSDLEDIVQRISHSTTVGRKTAPGTAGPLDRQAFARRRWVTRPRPGIDRMASAWLIRRFIDPQARFEFADQPARDAVPFDMFGVEFGHQGDACTFEVLAARFGVDDPAAAWIGRLVHDLDLRESRYEEPEAPGVGLMVDGLRRAHPDDRELLDRGIAFIESLAQGFQARDTPARTRARSRAGTRRTGRATRRTTSN
jgi:hypothetical protein